MTPSLRQTPRTATLPARTGRPAPRRALARRAGALLAIGASLVACGHDEPPAATSAVEVAAWNRLASDLVAANQPPPAQVRSMAMVQIAVHDALNAIEPRYEPYEHAGSAPGASLAAAVASAAHDVLAQVLPSAADSTADAYARRLASIDDGPAKGAGIAIGRAAAAAIVARRRADDLAAAIGKPYALAAAAPGVYQPTPPSNIVIAAGVGELAPFALPSAGHLRSAAPHPTASHAYAEQYHEVKALGSADSAARTAQQTETARFWYDAATREWHAAARQALAAAGADEWQAARVLALVGVAMFDVTVASMETKFHSNHWRPITAIRAGDADANDATPGDAAWTPLCATPPFPEHNSTHAATAAAAAGVLARTLGDEHAFAVASPTLAGVTRTYRRFSDAAREEAVSRIYCGIHFRHAMDTGLAQGDAVAVHVVGSVLRRTGS